MTLWFDRYPLKENSCQSNLISLKLICLYSNCKIGISPLSHICLNIKMQSQTINTVTEALISVYSCSATAFYHKMLLMGPCICHQSSFQAWSVKFFHFVVNISMRFTYSYRHATALVSNQFSNFAGLVTFFEWLYADRLVMPGKIFTSDIRN